MNLPHPKLDCVFVAGRKGRLVSLVGVSLSADLVLSLNVLWTVEHTFYVR